MCENHSTLGQDPTPFSQPCLIRPSSSKGRSWAAKAFPISPSERWLPAKAGCLFLTPMTQLLYHPDPDGFHGAVQDSSATMSPARGSPWCNRRSPVIDPHGHSTGTVHGLPLFLEQFVQFSKVQSIRKDADIKSSHVQEGFFVRLSAPLGFLCLGGDLGRGVHC